MFASSEGVREKKLASGAREELIDFVNCIRRDSKSVNHEIKKNLRDGSLGCQVVPEVHAENGHD